MMTNILGAIKYDLTELHQRWTAILFSSYANPDPVSNQHTPTSTLASFAITLWSLLGAPLIALSYPFLLIGFASRFYTHQINKTTQAMGVGKTTISIGVPWVVLTIFSSLNFGLNGIIAVSVASVVAILSVLLAFATYRVGGRALTILTSYPFSITALFLPPVSAALYSPLLAALIFPNSQTLAIWILDNLLAVGGLNTILRAHFELTGVSYLGMWFALAYPIGWFIGVAVLFADTIRPRMSNKSSGPTL